jgi:hypothetical protein
MVGGGHGGALVVRVREPAERGRANEAALRALSREFSLPRSQVLLVAGAGSRDKVVELQGDDAVLGRRLAELLDRPGP